MNTDYIEPINYIKISVINEDIIITNTSSRRIGVFVPHEKDAKFLYLGDAIHLTQKNPLPKSYIDFGFWKLSIDKRDQNA